MKPAPERASHRVRKSAASRLQEAGDGETDQGVRGEEAVGGERAHPAVNVGTGDAAGQGRR